MSFCRVCLVGDVKIYPIESNYILEIYEKLIDTKLSLIHEPHMLCYICHSLLQRIYRFTEMARSSESILSDLIHKGIERTYKNILLYPVKNNLSFTLVNITSFNGNNDIYNLNALNNPEITDIKEEIIIDNQELVTIDVDPTIIDEEILKDGQMFAEIDYQNLGLDSFSTFTNHDNTTVFCCNGCRKVFESQNVLYSHLQTFHKNSCLVCFKKFSEKTSLKKHMRIHTGEKPFPCTKCDKRFLDNFSLKKHTRTHTGEKPYTCPKCSKKFSDKSNLTNHLRTHTGEKPYVCIECGKTFTESSSLTKHIRTHTGEKPYSCLECDKTFSANSNLTTHMRTHTGIKPFSCTECDGKFVDKSSLNKHLKCHSTEKPFGCDECDAKFSRKYHAKVHMERHARSRAKKAAKSRL